MEIPKFENFPDYTRTVSIVSSLTVNYPVIFRHLKLSPYTVVVKRRGRRRKDEPDDPNKDLPDGSIINVKYRDKSGKVHFRGVNLKLGSTTCFHNNLCLVIKLGKLIDVKISQNGKFHLTGCQSEQQAEQCVITIYRKFEEIQRKLPEEQIIKLPEGESMTAIFNSVLINKTFSLGFNIKRNKLDQFLNQKTDDFVSVIDPDGNYAGIVVLLPVERPDDLKLTKIRYDEQSQKWFRSKADWHDFLDMLPPKDRNKILKKETEKNHTFLVFWNGQVILSSPFDYFRKEAFDHFVKTLTDNRAEFEQISTSSQSDTPTTIVF